MFRIYCLIICVLFSITLFAAGKAEIDSLNLIVNSEREDSMKVTTLNKLFCIYIYQDWDLAKQYIDKAEKICLDKELVSKLPAIYNNKGILFKINDQFDSALFYYEKSCDISQTINNRKILAKISII